MGATMREGCKGNVYTYLIIQPETRNYRATRLGAIAVFAIFAPPNTVG